VRADTSGATQSDFDEALFFACVAQDVHFTMALLASGANPKAKLRINTTALHHCFSVDILRMLIAAGADVNAVDADGITPLVALIRYGKDFATIEPLLRVYLAAPAINLDVAVDGRTPCEWAYFLEQHDVASVIQESKRGYLQKPPLFQAQWRTRAQINLSAPAHMSEEPHQSSTPEKEAQPACVSSETNAVTDGGHVTPQVVAHPDDDHHVSPGQQSVEQSKQEWRFLDNIAQILGYDGMEENLSAPPIPREKPVTAEDVQKLAHERERQTIAILRSQQAARDARAAAAAAGSGSPDLPTPAAPDVPTSTAQFIDMCDACLRTVQLLEHQIIGLKKAVWSNPTLAARNPLEAAFKSVF
jgi:hypothetical protein